MPEPLCGSLLTNSRSAVALLSETIGQFNEPAWTKPGVDSFQVLVTIAMHSVECLDYYFRSTLLPPGSGAVGGNNLMTSNLLPWKRWLTCAGWQGV